MAEEKKPLLPTPEELMLPFAEVANTVSEVAKTFKLGMEPVMTLTELNKDLSSLIAESLRVPYRIASLLENLSEKMLEK